MRLPWIYGCWIEKFGRMVLNAVWAARLCTRPNLTRSMVGQGTRGKYMFIIETVSVIMGDER